MCVFDYDQPVSILTGDEFKPKEGTTFARQVLDCFISIGGIAHSAFGDIILDMKGIQSDKSHGVGRIKASSFAAVKAVLEHGATILPLDYYGTGGKKQKTGMIAAPIKIGENTYLCVVVVIDNLKNKRLYLHEAFDIKEIPEIAASSSVHDSITASPQSRGVIAKVLQNYLKSK